MNAIAKIFISALAVGVAAYVLTGVRIDGYFIAVVVAVVLGVLNFFVRPILILLTLPITIFTLGLFLFVINALLVLLAGKIVPGFSVDGFLSALLFSLIVSIISFVLNRWAKNS